MEKGAIQRGEKNGVAGRVFGYARVSSRDQNLDRQIGALTEFGVSVNLIFSDKASGRDFRRPSYQRMMRRMRAGDTLVIKSIDRLGRCYADILEEWRRLTKERSLSIVVLDMPLLDTRGEKNGLTGEFIADLMLQLLSYVAQVERDNIRQRQAEGIAAARSRGVRFGRPPIVRPDQYARIKASYERGEITCAKASTACGVSPSTFLRWVRSDRLR